MKTGKKDVQARRLPSGSWRVQIRVKGESISITGTSKSEVEREARRRKAEIQSPEYQEEKKRKLAAEERQKASGEEMLLKYAIDRYIMDREATLSPSTIRGYRIVQKNYYQDYMETPLSELDWNELYRSEVNRLSGKTLQSSFSLLKSVYKHITGQIPPALQMKPKDVQRNPRPYLNTEQVPEFLKAIRGQRCEVAAILALHSLRCSEILALSWDDIDQESGKIYTNGAMVPGEDNKYTRKATGKTVAAKREVSVFIDQLWTAIGDVDKEKCSPAAYKTESGLCRAINSICAENNLPTVGIHGLRHTFASMAYSSGLGELETMRAGGWSDIQTMKKIYTHLSQDQVDSAVKKMHISFDV